MASGAAEKFGADYALAVTGFAGPGGGTDLDPVGTVYLGYASPTGVWSRRVHLPGEAFAPQAILPYPQALESRVALGGQQLPVRPIQPEDGERLRAFYAAASPADLRLRFLFARREVPASELARFSQIDYDREMTFIALAPPAEGQAAPMVGEVRAVCDPDNRQAEFAIQVAGDWQGRGLGGALLARMVSYLRSRGTGEMVGQCQSDNTRMAQLARRLGFRLGGGPADDLVDLRLDLGRAGG